VVSAHATLLNSTTLVRLRVEGLNGTIYEGPVLARPQNVTTAAGGTHPCDGLNAGANAAPGATCTSALAAAAKTARFTFDGCVSCPSSVAQLTARACRTYSAEFDDFFITRIGRSAQTASQFWGLLLDFQFAPVGGCQQEVRAGQRVLWAFDAFSKAYFLDLQPAGAPVARVGGHAAFVVKDGTTGVPIAGAVVGAIRGGTETATSAADGSVNVTFTTPGLKMFKAERSDSIRSNGVTILVL
jgi:hypothetical protein